MLQTRAQTTSPSFAEGPPDSSGSGDRLVRLAKLAAFILVVTAGLQFENPEAMSFAGRIVLNSWIVGAFLLMFRVYWFLSRGQRGDSIALSAAEALLA